MQISNDFKRRANGLNIKATEYQFSSEQNKFTDILSNCFVSIQISVFCICTVILIFANGCRIHNLTTESSLLTPMLTLLEKFFVRYVVVIILKNTCYCL